MSKQQMMYVKLPLYADNDYRYTVSLERVSYSIRIYFNERMQNWILDLRYSDGTPLVLGAAMKPNYPMFRDYVTGLSGFFWLRPIGLERENTIENKFELYKYYELRYYYPQEQ